MKVSEGVQNTFCWDDGEPEEGIEKGIWVVGWSGSGSFMTSVLEIPNLRWLWTTSRHHPVHSGWRWMGVILCLSGVQERRPASVHGTAVGT